jgi:hypothetical protein
VSTATVGDIQTAGNYTVLAGTGITTVPTSVITGNIAVWDANLADMTGFSFTDDVFSTQIIGTNQAYAKDADPEEDLEAAALDMIAVYDDAAGKAGENSDHLLSGGLNAVTLAPRIYTFTTDVSLTGDITFAGNGQYIIQITGNLVQYPNKSVILSGGALAENIYWQVTGTIAVGAGAHMKGILLGNTSVTLITGSSFEGRVFAQTLCALQSATITPE